MSLNVARAARAAGVSPEPNRKPCKRLSADRAQHGIKHVSIPVANSAGPRRCRKDVPRLVQERGVHQPSFRRRSQSSESHRAGFAEPHGDELESCPRPRPGGSSNRQEGRARNWSMTGGPPGT